ncbi:MAG: tyrosine-type recombinase/integrase [Acidimicrobiales bacterium]
MPGRSKKPPRGERRDLDPAAVLRKYRSWLRRQPLAERSREAYLAQVSSFVTWLAASEHGAQALEEGSVRDWAVRDYKRHVKKARRWAPTSVNQALAAIDNFYRSLGLGRPEVGREELAQVAPRSLAETDQRRFLRAVASCPSARDRAIATLFFYAGLRLAELAALDVDDLSVSARRGRVQVRSGKGDAYREVPLNSACRKALDEWGKARAEQLGDMAERTEEGGEPEALWLSRTGGRMSARAIDMALRRLAADAKVELSAHTLRRTALTNLVRSGADIVMVAEIGGHRRLDTVRRYSLPSEADKDAALEAVLVEI